MIELELASHYEALAQTSAEDYEKVAAALKAAPLYHQWRTYQAKDAHIVVNSYNTGTGKTKAALLRLLDLDEAYKQDRYTNANVLFIAPTNELLRQHEQDIERFIEDNHLSHLVLRLDAATIKALGQQHLGEKFTRQGDRLHQMLQDPRSVLLDKGGYHVEGHHPYVLVINPDIFYYALYDLGNPHDQRVLFRSFLNMFQYIVIDEFHYYNAKQLANFLFFLTLSREWEYFSRGRKICLLTATPAQQVKAYLEHLNLDIEYIVPGSEPPGLETTPALAPVRLHLWSAEALEDGLVSLAASEKRTVEDWLQQGRHGAFISSALWRVNSLFQVYGGKRNQQIGRLTGAEQAIWREQHKYAPLLMATPTVDIGYNFSRPGKKSQSIDFLFFDARSSDEFIQRLGRAGRVLGKQRCNIPSDVYAVVPEDLLTKLSLPADKTIERAELNKLVNEILPQKNGMYAYVSSGAVAEAFLPFYHVSKALPRDEKQQAEQLYQAVVQVYGTRNARSFASLTFNIQKYLKIKAKLPELLSETNAKQFTFGTASLMIRAMDEQPDVQLDELDKIDAAIAKTAEDSLLRTHRVEKAVVKRREEIEEYFVTNARFNFRDNFQPPLALAYDPEGFLATAEYTTYSALHIVQNYVADWFDDSQQQYSNVMENAGQAIDKQVQLCCVIRKPLDQRLRVYFKLGNISLTKKRWEERYCSMLAATDGFRLHSDNGPVPSEMNALFEQNWITFYAVPSVGPEALALNKLCKTTSLFTNLLRVDFSGEGEFEYMLVVGTAALLVAYERSIINAKYVAKKVSARGSHLFDWSEAQ